MKRKGIVLAGGYGTRLSPLTEVVSKQLLPVYDKPMIFYPLTTLMQFGITEVAIITRPQDRNYFEKLIGNGNKWNLKITYLEQPSPDGLAQAYIIAKEFLNGAPSVMILGDNIFLGGSFPENFLTARDCQHAATVFAKEVENPKRFGVPKFNSNNELVGVTEKPLKPSSKYALLGLYFFDERAPILAEGLRPSDRKELEITDLIRKYIEEKTINCMILDSAVHWFDAGTFDSLLEAANQVALLNKNLR